MLNDSRLLYGSGLQPVAQNTNFLPSLARRLLPAPFCDKREGGESDGVDEADESGRADRSDGTANDNDRDVAAKQQAASREFDKLGNDILWQMKREGEESDGAG